MRNRIIRTTTLAGLVAIAACFPRVQQPQVTLEGARLASLGLTGGVVDLRLSVYNPNRFAVQARALSYDLDLQDPGREDWFELTAGRIESDFRVEARDTMEVVVPVEFTYRGLGDAVRGLVERGSFDYRVSGVVELQSPVRRNIRYQHTGRFSPGGSGGTR